MFQDEFDYLNMNKWKHEVNIDRGNNDELQMYGHPDTQGENAYVRDGILIIRPTLTLDYLGGSYEKLYNGYVKLDGCTGSTCDFQGNYPNILPPVMSARLTTDKIFSFTYGKVQVRAQMPSGDWTWPAIWLLPEAWVYGGWPNSGEIDIVETRGNRNLTNANGVNIGAEQMGSTLHYGPGWPNNGWWAAHGERNTAPNQGYDRDFHIYEVEWTPDSLTFRLDGTDLKVVNPPAGGFFELGAFDQSIPNPWTGSNVNNTHMAPFDQGFHFILNVAAGGNFFPTDSVPPPPWANSQDPAFLAFMNAEDSWKPTWTAEDHAMKIDYIRVYAI